VHDAREDRGSRAAYRGACWSRPVESPGQQHRHAAAGQTAVALMSPQRGRNPHGKITTLACATY